MPSHPPPPLTSISTLLLPSPLMAATSCLFLLLASAAMAVAAPAATAAGALLGLDFHHRFSAAVRGWAESTGHHGFYSPTRGSAEYYAALAGHDRRRRSLASGASAGDGELAFVDGNTTVRVSSLGYLHYAVVALGTPNATFFVALDTGSDLFWVPCDCVKCAPLTAPNYGKLEFDTYNPKSSSTSQMVPCNSSFCSLQSSCPGATSGCPYVVQYLSDNTSSSGVLVEDVLYFTTEAAQSKVVKAPIIFGCGQVQTGSFLGSAAPNGLLGLGMESISVPSLLARKGFAANSFSMCFGDNGIGRINFGDRGSSDQLETSFNFDKQNPSYNISITGMMVGNSSIHTTFNAIVDSGTSFTSLADPMYTQLTSSFNAQVQESRNQLDSSLPFDYCYSLSAGQTGINLPNVSLTAKGGSIFPVNDPIIVLLDMASNPSGYCLAVVKSNNVNIIGENFMSGLRIVFDRERMVLGWKNFDCYNVANSSTLPVNSNSSSVPPKAASGPSSYTPEATNSSPDGTQITVLHPSANTSQMNSIRGIFLVIALLLPVIL